jgi:hypothetical protein
VPAELPWTAYIGVVYAARQLASDALDTAAEPDLVALGDDLGSGCRTYFGSASDALPPTRVLGR